MFAALQSVLKNPHYQIIFAVLFIFSVAFVVLLPNVPLLWGVAMLPDATIVESLELTGALLLGLFTNFSFLGILYVLLLGLLFSFNLVLSIAYFRRFKGGGLKAATPNSLGALLAVLGVGCASCGTVIAASIFSLLGLSVEAFPLMGFEFGILGILLLIFSTWILLRKLAAPLVC